VGDLPAGQLLVDTGNDWPLMLHTPFVLRHGLGSKGGGEVAVTGVGGSQQLQRFTVERLVLGDVEFRDVGALLARSGEGALALTESIGNVGAGLFQESVVAFDYGAGSMWVAPSATARSASRR
jgi:hypothetical protein